MGFGKKKEEMKKRGVLDDSFDHALTSFEISLQEKYARRVVPTSRAAPAAETVKRKELLIALAREKEEAEMKSFQRSAGGREGHVCSVWVFTDVSGVCCFRDQELKRQRLRGAVVERVEQQQLPHNDGGEGKIGG